MLYEVITVSADFEVEQVETRAQLGNLQLRSVRFRAAQVFEDTRRNNFV